MIVVDCSALVSFLLRPRADEKLAKAISGSNALAAPDFLDVETVSALRRQELAKLISTAEADRAVDLFRQARIGRYPVQDLLSQLWKLRRNFGAHDAAYVALAQTLGVPLLTLDLRLQRAVAQFTKIALI